MNNQIITYMNQELILHIRVSPGARRSGIAGVWNETAIKIALRAPAVDGKANAALIDFLADFLDVRKSAIVIESGELSRQKRIRIQFPTETLAQEKGALLEQAMS